MENMMKLYALSCDAQAFGIADKAAAKLLIMDKIIELAQDQTVKVERHMYQVHGLRAHPIIGFWHVFTNTGYHQIEVVEL
jgi:hypothetical protein